MNGDNKKQWLKDEKHKNCNTLKYSLEREKKNEDIEENIVWTFFVNEINLDKK